MKMTHIQIINFTENKHEKIKRVRKTIKIATYCSLVLDVCTAIVTTMSILHVGNPEPFLMPLNYMLTLVVALSIVLFITLLFLRHQEAILDNLLQRKYKYKPKSRSIIYKIKKILKTFIPKRLFR